MLNAALIVIANDEDKVLLQHKDSSAPKNPNRWCLFGGGIESGESPKDAIKRELIEELEWNVDKCILFLENESLGIHRHIFFIKTTRLASELKKNLHEGDNLGYFSKEELENIDIIEPHLEILMSYYDNKII